MTDHYVRPDVRQFLDYLNALPGPRTHELDPVAARQMFTATKDLTDLPVGDLATIRDIVIPGPDGPIPARLFDAAETRVPGPVMVFYHGGGFVFGEIETHASLCAEMARVLGMPVLSVEYRLAPEHRWPAAPDDAEAAARWVASNPAALGRTATGLVLSGDSAGGMLAIVTAMALRDRPAAVPVIAQAPLYPVTDPAGRYPSFEEFAEGYLLTKAAMLWFGDAYQADIAHMRGSPMLAPLAGMPPAVIVAASLDPLRDQGRAYAARLIEAGVPTVYREAVGTVHGFATLRKAIPSAVGDIAGFLVALKAVVAESEAARVMAQAAR
ncbi:alpha/beta hydrolase [Sphingomonas sp. CFBP 8760]|uniref:alpha/beta hydrolase n=1 Tax=Sphingomonas sp. CFBP 8760 TaxID=2775282 RepID=UPI001780FD76|nr:alpha/beta hydrolase [Sphingomonas sp. CFBP 8760]MBD8548710.1 alpha/beta hydrolase [Sphingomonas sp. CFBP 8760]